MVCVSRTPSLAGESLQLAETIDVGGNGLGVFDISFVDSDLGLYVLSDRTNASIDLVDTTNNSFLGRIGGFVGVAHKPDGTANTSLSGPDGVVIVDWPHACRGAAFVDEVFFAPSVAMQGGPELMDLLALSAAGRSAEPQRVAAMVCALGGYFTYQSLRPAPPGLPTVRAFQAAQGEVTRRWLAQLL